MTATSTTSSNSSNSQISLGEVRSKGLRDTSVEVNSTMVSEKQQIINTISELFNEATLRMFKLGYDKCFCPNERNEAQEKAFDLFQDAVNESVWRLLQWDIDPQEVPIISPFDNSKLTLDQWAPNLRRITPEEDDSFEEPWLVYDFGDAIAPYGREDYSWLNPILREN